MTSEEIFLNLFFKFLNQERINYFILRNYQSLPVTVSGTDIDILVDKSFNSEFRDKLINLSNQVNYRFWKGYRKNYSIYHMIFVPNQLNNTQHVIRIDFMKNKFSWLGMELIESKKLWKHTIVEKNLHCLNEPMSNALSILNGLLYVGNVKIKYYEQYDQFSSDEKGLVQNYIANILNELSETIKEEIKNRKFRKIRYRFIKARRFPAFKIISGVFTMLHTFVARLISPPGNFVALVGPDGSGKSTLASLMNVKCKRMYAGIDYFHLFPKISLFRLFDKISHSRWENRQKKKIPEWKMRERQFGLFPSLARLLYLWFRFLFGYFSVYYHLMKGYLVISDRWCYDIMIDPGSKGIKLPENIRKIFTRLIPKPDKIIALIGDPETIADRKSELNVPTIAKQLNIMKTLFSGRSNIKFVNTDKSPDKCFQKALRFIVK